MAETFSHIRLATDADYQRIYDIWMQKHIICWMSFLPTENSEEFKPIYAKLKNKSDIYVMIANVDGEEKVVGVRRIQYGKGTHAHTAEFCSMGIDEAHLGHGYGRKCTEEFEKIVKSKGIEIIRLTQSGGNNPAFLISDKIEYSVQAIFPDWLKRKGKNEEYHFVLERHICKVLDKEFEKKLSQLPSLKYNAKLPSLTPSARENELSVTLENDKVTVSHQGNSILTFEYAPDHSVIQHIAFLDDVILQSADTELCKAALRKALSYLLEKGDVKKLELFIDNPEISTLCQQLGFWIRGELIGARKENDAYRNELGVEYSYFGILDAKFFIKSFDAENDDLKKAFNACEEAISALEKNGECDALGRRYLENIVYQMVRDCQQTKNYVSLLEKPWQKIIEQCPTAFQATLRELDKKLKGSTLVNTNCPLSHFFVANKSLQAPVAPTLTPPIETPRLGSTG